MIQQFVDAFMRQRQLLRATFKERRPESYKDIVEATVELFRGVKDSSETRFRPTVVEVEGGSYQGTNLYVIRSTDDTYYYVLVDYGSCTGCDTLENLNGGHFSEKERLDGYMTLALHIVQKLKLCDGERV